MQDSSGNVAYWAVFLCLAVQQACVFLTNFVTPSFCNDPNTFVITITLSTQSNRGALLWFLLQVLGEKVWHQKRPEWAWRWIEAGETFALLIKAAPCFSCCAFLYLQNKLFLKDSWNSLYWAVFAWCLLLPKLFYQICLRKEMWG